MNKMKNFLKMWLLPLLLVMIIVDCDDRIGVTSPPILTIPTVSSTNPINGATDVVFTQQIIATFSEAMNSSTITTATFTLMQGASFVSGTVSYSGTTATFTPSSNLTPNTEYTATITTGAKDIESSSLTNNHVWSFTTGTAAVIIPPNISLTDPVNAETSVALNQKIAATFSVIMDAATITSSTFTLMQGSTPVSGFVSYSGTTATFAPASNLTPNTAYTGTITTGAKDLSGNSLSNNYVWSFTTGSSTVVTAPTVSYTDPANSATSVTLNQKIAATFSKTMDVSTITTTTFTLKQGINTITGVVSYSGTTATFAPSSNLLPSTLYTATITTGAKDLAGNPIATNYVWSFTTAAAVIITPPEVIYTDPDNVAINVALNQKIVATFSKTMDATTITTLTFTLKQGTTSVSGLVSYSGTTATFTPTNILLSNSTYTATITTSAKDLAGNALTNNYVWSFTTGATPVVTPPTVNSTDPVDAAIGVALNKQIKASFSKTMNATTITTSTFILKHGLITVSGTVSYSGMTATFSPSSNLSPSTTYTATITTDAKDLADNALINNYEWSFTTAASSGSSGQAQVILGTSARFAILSNSAITNIPTSSITGDVGLSPGVRSSIAGLTNPEVIGTIFAADDAIPVPEMLIAAKNDAEAAYLNATAAVRGTPTSISGNINGLTLVPGLYESGTSIEISPGGILYLDGQGDVNAVFVIRSATSITTSATSEVRLTNGANAANIYWAAGSAVTLGTNSKMKGTIIASTSISLQTGARLDGRALIQGAAAGQVSLDKSIIVLP